MQIEPCKRTCHECGFLRGSLKGVLTSEVRGVISRGMLFPCHLQLKAVTGSENQGIELYATTQSVIKICRGYVQAMYKLGIPAGNAIWKKLYADVAGDDMSNIMDIPETLAYHER